MTCRLARQRLRHAQCRQAVRRVRGAGRGGGAPQDRPGAAMHGADGRQGGAVQEIRRPGCLRHRNQRNRPGQAGRDHRRPGSHLRRHQPGRHQGAGMLRGRAQAARAHEDPGVP
ncbi:hypothetical protein G6F59_017184 [Rhizopus arrhizus]|nr:hypothetical protein G6F59_017184 [Rhizopus arrhizus]